MRTARLAAAALLISLCSPQPGLADATSFSDDASGFVVLTDAVPDAVLEMRYYSTYNFVGERIAGYEPPATNLHHGAIALKFMTPIVRRPPWRIFAAGPRVRIPG